MLKLFHSRESAMDDQGLKATPVASISLVSTPVDHVDDYNYTKECVDSIDTATYITKLNLLKGYWRVPCLELLIFLPLSHLIIFASML